jgi:hypothetical protein
LECSALKNCYSWGTSKAAAGHWVRKVAAQKSTLGGIFSVSPIGYLLKLDLCYSGAKLLANTPAHSQINGGGVWR